MKVPEPRQLKSGTWFIQLRLGGESVSVSAPTPKECKDKAALIKAEHRNGKRAKTATGANLTLTQAIDNYIESKSNTLSPATIRGYRIIQRNRFASVMDKRLKDISNWQTVCNDEAKICSAKTLKNAWGFISSVLRENGVQPQKITLPQVVTNERSWLEPNQITTFIKAIQGTDCEIPALLALHSLRRSEVCALTWNDIDLKSMRIFVRGAKVPDENHKFINKKTTKNRTSNRVVPMMIPELSKALKAVENKTGAVVKYMPNTICGQINRVCKANDLPLVGVHGLRHSFASLAYHIGMPEKECMRIGGWADGATMHKIYTHLSEMDVTKYQNKMADFYINANKNANKKPKAPKTQAV